MRAAPGNSPITLEEEMLFLSIRNETFCCGINCNWQCQLSVGQIPQYDLIELPGTKKDPNAKDCPISER
jgi:hypothetical protein